MTATLLSKQWQTTGVFCLLKPLNLAFRNRRGTVGHFICHMIRTEPVVAKVVTWVWHFKTKINIVYINNEQSKYRRQKIPWYRSYIASDLSENDLVLVQGTSQVYTTHLQNFKEAKTRCEYCNILVFLMLQHNSYEQAFVLHKNAMIFVF